MNKQLQRLYSRTSIFMLNFSLLFLATLFSLQSFAQCTWTSSGSFNTSGSGTHFGMTYDGTHYFVTNTFDRIDKYDVNGNLVMSWGQNGNGNLDFNFNSPQGIDLGSNGLLYIADDGNDRVAVYDKDGNWQFHITHSQIDGPRGLKIINDKVYVANRWSVKITIFDLNGNLISSFTPSGSVWLQNMYEHNNLIYVLRGQSSVEIHDLNGAPVGQFNTVANWAADIEIIDDNNVLIADPNNGQLLVYDINGNLNQTISGNGWPITQFAGEIHWSHYGNIEILYCQISGPANDDLCNAQTLMCGDLVTGSTANATLDAPPTGSHCGSGGATANNVWYVIDGTGQAMEFSLCGSAYNTRLDIYCDDTNNCTSGNFNCAGGNDDFCGLESAVVLNTAIGKKYYVMVHGYHTSNGSYTLEVSCTASMAPANNDCDGTGAGCRLAGTAQSISLSSNTCLSPNYGDLSNTDIAQNNGLISCQSLYTTVYDAWYTFTSNVAADIYLDYNPLGAGPMGFSIYDNCGGTELVCLNGLSTGSQLLFSATANTDYYIQFWTTASNASDFEFCIYEEILGCTDPSAHNFNPLATTDDQSCETCSDGAQNGDETGVDCGGMLCGPCLPDIFITNLSVSNTQVSVGDQMTAYLTQNISDPTYQGVNSDVEYYVSMDMVLDASDQLVGTDYSSIGNGDAYDNENMTFTLGTYPDGIYYILAFVDSDLEVAETDEVNNIQAIQFEIVTLSSGDDFYIQAESVSTAILDAGDSFSVSCRQYYSGSSPTTLKVKVGYYLSVDNAFDPSDVLLGSDRSTLSINDAFDPEYANLAIDGATAPGNYFILFVSDYPQTFAETDEINNVESLPITVNGSSTTDDFWISNEALSNFNVNPGETITMSCRQNYQGSSSSNLYVYMAYYFSTDPFLDASDTYIDDDFSSLSSSDTYDPESDNFTIPVNTPSGTYYILFVADDPDDFVELDETNNLLALSFNIVSPPTPIFEDDRPEAQLEMSAGTEEQLNLEMELENYNLEIFPNPVFNDLQLGMAKHSDDNQIKTIKYQCFDKLGRLLIQGHSDQELKSLDVTSIPSGIFFVKIFTLDNELIISKKVIKY